VLAYLFILVVIFLFRSSYFWSECGSHGLLKLSPFGRVQEEPKACFFLDLFLNSLLNGVEGNLPPIFALKLAKCALSDDYDDIMRHLVFNLTHGCLLCLNLATSGFVIVLLASRELEPGRIVIDVGLLLISCQLPREQVAQHAIVELIEMTYDLNCSQHPEQLWLIKIHLSLADFIRTNIHPAQQNRRFELWKLQRSWHQRISHVFIDFHFQLHVQILNQVLMFDLFTWVSRKLFFNDLLEICLWSSVSCCFFGFLSWSRLMQLVEIDSSMFRSIHILPVTKDGKAFYFGNFES